MKRLAFSAAYVLVCAMLNIAGAYGQVGGFGLSGPPIVGATPGFGGQTQSPYGGLGQSLTPNIGYGQSLTPVTHRDSNGRPCIYVQGEARPQIINPNIYEHVLIIKNDCSMPIKLNVCYFGTEDCVDATVAAFTRRQEIFGFGLNRRDYRFEYREYFN